jgi:hypothetical protein
VTTKKIEVVVCDFPHKRDRPAVQPVTIDVCAQHARLFEHVEPESQFECELCGNKFKKVAGLNHHWTVKHKGKKRIKAAS